MEQLVKETLISLKDYLDRLVPAVEEMSEYFVKQQESEGLKILVQAIEGLQWTMEVVTHTKPTLETYGIEVDELRLQEVFGELTDALQNQDYVLVSDLIQYEILEFLNTCKSGLNKINFELQ